MAKALNISVDEYEELLEEIRPATYVCLDSVQGNDGDGASVYDVIADDSQADPEHNTAVRELAGLIEERLQQLPEMQRKVLALYYFEDMRLREIAEAFGVTESRICQIHSQAILAIKAAAAKRKTPKFSTTLCEPSMIVILGAIIVLCSVIGGFVLARRQHAGLAALSRVDHHRRRGLRGAGGDVAAQGAALTCSGSAAGDLARAPPTSRKAYEELFKALYELFMLGRRGGMVALEEHVMAPETSAIFTKYPVVPKEQAGHGISLQRLAPHH